LNPESPNTARAEAEPLAGLLQSAVSIMKSCGTGYADLISRLQSLQERFREGIFHLAALGQTKRGKSTLLNALLGENILPTSVIPLTAIPTFLRAGPKLKARVIFKDGRASQELTGEDSSAMREALAGFISEELNPNNRLGVEQVEIEHPSPILKPGLVLIDTPGIGSTFEHNTEATLNFLPQCDAALFVVSPDPPITEVEVEFLKEVRSKISRLFFVFNKADYLSEQDLDKSVAFLKRALREKAGLKDVPVIFRASSLLGLKAKLAGSAADLEKSGLNKIEFYLIKFLAQNKQKALGEAIFGKAQALIREAQMHLDLSIASLKMPIETLELKRERLREKLEEARNQRKVQQDLVEGDRKRILENLGEQAQDLRERAEARIQDALGERCEKSGARDEKDLEKDLERIIPTLFEHEYGVLSRGLEHQVKALLGAHQRRAEQLMEEGRKDAAEIFVIPFAAGESLESFELEHNPHWVTHQWNTTFGLPPAEWLDALLPRRLRKRKMMKRINEQIQELVSRNVENIRWSSLQIIQDSFRNFSELLDRRLAEAVGSIQEAIEVAYLKRQERAEGVAEQMRIWEQAEHQLKNLLENNRD